MNATTQFPWAMVVSNAVWICGLAVILAAFGWYDYKRRELKERNLKVAATNQEKPSLKGAATKRAADEPPDATAGLPSDVAAGFSLRSGGPSSFRRDSFKKPVLLGLIMVAGGGALSVHSPLPAAFLAIAALGLVVVFVKRFFLGRAKSTIDDEERRRRARSAAGQGASGLGDLAKDHDKYFSEAADDKD